jgi:CubicO group peptidase (beta-lactamase class C family)
MAMDSERLDRTLIDGFNRSALAGLAAGIVKDGQLVYARAFGLADAGRKIPAATDTSFRIGSISKTFTAIALMQLHEQGKFKLDDSVSGHLKAYKLEQPRTASPITFRHLLTHTSGLGELRRLTDLIRPTIGLARKPGKLQSLAQYYTPALRADVAPDVKWAYANHGFATVGQLVEDISGQPFAEYMREHVFAPLGMDRTDYVLSERVRDALAVGYRMTGRGLKPIPYMEIAVGPAGSVFSSVEQMAKYVCALLAGGANDHGRVLGVAALAMMLTPHYQLDSRLSAQGLAFMLGYIDGIRMAGHDGGWRGFTSAMWLAPERGVGAVVFTNTSTLLAPHALAIELIRQACGVNGQAAGRPLVEQPTLWSELCGTYRPLRGFNSNFRLWGLGGALRIFVRKGRLMIGGRHPFGPVRRGLELHAVDHADPLLFRAELRAEAGGLEIGVLFRRNSRDRVDSMDVTASAGTFFTLHRRVRR